MAFLDETGLTHLWAKITNKFLPKSNVANNLTTTSEGYALDARQGVTLMNAISSGGSGMKLSGNLVYENQEGTGSKTITLEKDAFCSFYVTGGSNVTSSTSYIVKASVSVNNTGIIAVSNENNKLPVCISLLLKKGAKIDLYAESKSKTGDTLPTYKSEARVFIQYFE